jgi:tRNA pseudouridine55 synthase
VLHGIVNVNKEKGYTSHDVVAKMRGILRQKRIGHAGTLDPDATGVLPVCVGNATRAVEFVSGQGKAYRAVLLLGRVTDTQDATGDTLWEARWEAGDAPPAPAGCGMAGWDAKDARSDVGPPGGGGMCADPGAGDGAQVRRPPTQEEVRGAISHFIGGYAQVPPMYSALRVGGKRLYELARAGKEVEREPRWVDIADITIECYDFPRVTMTVECSKGTYIRTLCHDIGQLLGVGGCMESLVRTRVGRFLLEDALTLGEIEGMVRGKAAAEPPVAEPPVAEPSGAEPEAGTGVDGAVHTFLHPVEELFGAFPRMQVLPGYGHLLRNGNPLGPGMVAQGTPGGQMVQMCDCDGRFVGIFAWNEDVGRWMPRKMFV